MLKLYAVVDKPPLKRTSAAKAGARGLLSLALTVLLDYQILACVSFYTCLLRTVKLSTGKSRVP